MNLLQRHGNDRLIRHIDLLRQSVRVVLLNHLHCMIEWSEGNRDFALRWRLIKRNFRVIETLRFGKAVSLTQFSQRVEVGAGGVTAWEDCSRFIDRHGRSAMQHEPRTEHKSRLQSKRQRSQDYAGDEQSEMGKKIVFISSASDLFAATLQVSPVLRRPRRRRRPR